MSTIPSVTDGEIAAINLDSARRGAWARFARDPRSARVAEALVDMERLTAQFLGDLDALNRLDALASQFASVDKSFRAALIDVEVLRQRIASTSARTPRACHATGGPSEEIERHSLTIDQACGVELDAVLVRVAELPRTVGLKIWCLSAPCLRIWNDSPRRMRSIGRRSTHTTALRRSRWRGSASSSACCGGARARTRCESRGALVSARIAYLPGYVKARVHLAEIYVSQDQIGHAQALLVQHFEPRSGGPMASC